MDDGVDFLAEKYRKKAQKMLKTYQLS